MSTNRGSKQFRVAAVDTVGRWVGHMAVGLVMVFMITPGVVAAAISQGYQADESFTPGVLVSSEQSSGQAGKAVLANTTNADNLIGAVVNTKDATLAVSGPSDKLQVATSGSAEVFVSDLQGEVKSGDAIAPSPISGIGMKAADAGKIVGVAQNDVTDTGKTAEVTENNGTKKTVKVGRVTVVLQVAYYSPPQQKTYVPQFLQVFANSVAGKQVSLARLIASAFIVLAATIAIAILLFSATRSTMVSIGRNPLAQSSIYRGLWQVIFTSLAIFVAALGGAYLVLTR